jgi:hypothetical protein
MMGYRGQVPDIETFTLKDVPMAMKFYDIEHEESLYTKRLKHHPEFWINRYGWKLAHIDACGFGNAQNIEQMPLARIQDKFYKLLSPHNLFVVPKHEPHASLAEDKDVLATLRSFGI